MASLTPSTAAGGDCGALAEGLVLLLLVSPKIRSRAAWYRASRAAYELSGTASGDVLPDNDVDEDDEDAGLGVGRLRMRSTGWKAAGGGEATLDPFEADMTSCGMGARLLL